MTRLPLSRQLFARLPRLEPRRVHLFVHRVADAARLSSLKGLCHA